MKINYTTSRKAFMKRSEEYQKQNYPKLDKSFPPPISNITGTNWNIRFQTADGSQKKKLKVIRK
jgi:hypothetical protein